jgi:ATP-dependent Clp protease ATP-binding subunit ClpA
MGNAIVEYAEAYNKGPLLDDKAKKLLDEALAIEEAETKLKRSYVPKLEKVLPPAKVARYMQIENKIRAVVRYELANGIPLAQ